VLAPVVVSVMRPPPLLVPDVLAPELEPLRLLDEPEAINPLYRSSPFIEVDPSFKPNCSSYPDSPRCAATAQVSGVAI
jgi:hypothetical protein